MKTLGHPYHRSIVVVDVEASTTRTNTGRGRARHDMYRIFQAALTTAGVVHRDPLADRGDGILALIHPTDETPKTLLLSTVLPVLGKVLGEHNTRWPERNLRLRVAVHAGEVHYDAHGCYGEDIDLAVRLLDAPEVKLHLENSTAPLVLVTSDAIYRSVIRHEYAGVSGTQYAPLVNVRLGDSDHRGWVQLVSRAPAIASFRFDAQGRDPQSTHQRLNAVS
jgi:hypothetical protein